MQIMPPIKKVNKLIEVSPVWESKQKVRFNLTYQNGYTIHTKYYTRESIKSKIQDIIERAPNPPKITSLHNYYGNTVLNLTKMDRRFFYTQALKILVEKQK